jgi:hypothetical protein
MVALPTVPSYDHGASSRGWPSPRLGSFSVAPLSIPKSLNSITGFSWQIGRKTARAQKYQNFGNILSTKYRPRWLSGAHSRRLIGAWVWANYGTRKRPAVTLTLSCGLMHHRAAR